MALARPISGVYFKGIITVNRAPRSSILALGFRLLGGLGRFLLAEVGFDLMPEEQHAQLAVRGLVHGLGLHAHAVLVGAQLVGAVLLVPQVEQASGGRAHHQQVAMEILPVEVDVLAAPAFNVHIKPSWRKEREEGRREPGKLTTTQS